MSMPIPQLGSPASQRVLAALRGEPVDRVPFALWRHFHQEEGDPEALAQVTWEFAQSLDVDLVKLTPSPFYAIEDWGAEVHYPNRGEGLPTLRRPLVREPEAWRDLPSLDLETGALARELEALRLLRARDRGRLPILMTIYSPLTLAHKMAGDRVLEHLREAPQALHFGLAIIAETTARFAKRACAVGADGIFFVCHLASRAHLTEEEYAAFGEHYDRVVLEAVGDSSWCTVLHLHGEEVFFGLAERYPVHAMSWDDQAPGCPSLAQALSLTSKGLMGGLRRETLRDGSPEDVTREVQRALQHTQGRRLILAPSCNLLPGTPEANLRAVRAAL